MKKLKVALVHDYLKEYGGAERVLETLHEIFPEAPVFTLVYLPKFLGPHAKRFANWQIKTSLAQYLPFKAKLISPLRLLAPFLFKQFDFSGFDIIITSATGAYCPNLINKQSAKLICYCHTPPRYLYGYATARQWKENLWLRVLGELANHFLRLVDFRAAQNVDLFIANSEEVKARIAKFYRKKAVVSYPPVDVAEVAYKNFLVPNAKKIEKFASVNSENFASSPQHYFLAGGRLARPKHIDLIVETCAKLNLPLKVFGKDFAGYEKGLKKMAGSAVKFVGEVTDEEKFTLLQNAKAYIFAGEDEDFGILPVEAMAAGIPVIAYKSGGVKETIVAGKTGLFFDQLTVASLTKAIQQFYNMTFKQQECLQQAKKFSKERFAKEIEEVIN